MKKKKKSSQKTNFQTGKFTKQSIVETPFSGVSAHANFMDITDQELQEEMQGWADEMGIQCTVKVHTMPLSMFIYNDISGENINE